MNRHLSELYSLLDNGALSGGSSEDIFNLDVTYCYAKPDIDFLLYYFHGLTRSFHLAGNAALLFELSPSAFDIIFHAWLSELPIEKEITAFACKVLSAAKDVQGSYEKRRAAQKAENDRGDADTLCVLNASGKVYHEIHRLNGLLRFNPNPAGEFIAKCEPDHFILPAFAVYFTARFGDTPWSIIDEKRALTLRRQPPNPAEISLNQSEPSILAKNDEWEELWKHYHKTINNEDRNNPNLQRQLMPQRYWKYLPEVK